MTNKERRENINHDDRREEEFCINSLESCTVDKLMTVSELNYKSFIMCMIERYFDYDLRESRLFCFDMIEAFMIKDIIKM